MNILGLDDYLGFSACSSQQPVMFCTCKDGERIGQEWFMERGLDKLTKQQKEK
jgi:hypothetical protein